MGREVAVGKRCLVLKHQIFALPFAGSVHVLSCLQLVLQLWKETLDLVKVWESRRAVCEYEPSSLARSGTVIVRFDDISEVAAGPGACVDLTAALCKGKAAFAARVGRFALTGQEC